MRNAMASDVTQLKPQPTDEDGGFQRLLEAIHRRFAENAGPLFLVNLPAGTLYEVFRKNLPSHLWQHYLCRCCTHFTDRWGGLMVMDENGRPSSAVWPEPEQVPEAFRMSLAGMRGLLVKQSIAGVFLASEAVLGTPTTGAWNHMSLPLPTSRRHRDRVKTATQVMAERTEERGMLIRGLDEFSQEIVRKANTYLTGGDFYRSEKSVEMVAWLLSIHEMRDSQNERKVDNLLWKAVATAPAGWCHVKTGMVGTLLDDIKTNLPLDEIKRKWAEKMNPAQYMRAQVAPAAGNIAQAEKIIATLQAEGSLERRYLRLDEIKIKHATWYAPTPRVVPAAGGVFGHLTPKVKAPKPDDKPVLPERTMTWEKFQRTVLAQAITIEVKVPASSERFVALVTAAQEKAPVVLQWDDEEERNPVSWYYAAGIDAELRRRLLKAGGKHEGCDVRASLIWNNRNDLDIHVIAPSGEEIYYAHKYSRCGGGLDVDMNVSGETTEPVENIRWKSGEAPTGIYQIYVQNFRFHEPRYSCPTPFRVELEVSGEVYHYDGVISPRGETKEPSNVQVARFRYVRGQKLTAVPTGMRPAALQAAWGLAPGAWAKVMAIVPSPNLWGKKPLTQHGQHTFFVLDGCRDTAQGVGRGLFVETLRSEFHSIRSTLEAYMASVSIAGGEDANACGIGLNNQLPWDLDLRVQTADAVSTYHIDRWD